MQVALLCYKSHNKKLLIRRYKLPDVSGKQTDSLSDQHFVSIHKDRKLSSVALFRHRFVVRHLYLILTNKTECPKETYANKLSSSPAISLQYFDLVQKIF